MNSGVSSFSNRTSPFSAVDAVSASAFASAAVAGLWPKRAHVTARFSAPARDPTTSPRANTTRARPHLTTPHESTSAASVEKACKQMVQPSRLAALPGYDTAPDIYETAETDDASTTLTQRTSPRSPSETDETTDEDEEESYGVSRRRLYPERARQRFREGAGEVDARGVDLSDRVDGKRRGYGVRRRREGETREEESLEARIARLRREVEECRVEAERERGEEGEGEGESVEGLTGLLARLEVPTVKTRGAVKQPPAPPEPDGEPADEQTLTRVADFDARLSALEHALGLSSLDAASTGHQDPVAAPLLPSLAILDQQLAALSSAASLAGLDAARARVQSLRAEADAARTTGPDDDAASLTPDDRANLHALYALIPTLSSLAPTIPALLARLRSLRTLHTAAGGAGEDLDELERRQGVMEAELREWREGLEGVEGAVRLAGEANGRNGKVVEGWVGELMGRVEGLGR